MVRYRARLTGTAARVPGRSVPDTGSAADSHDPSRILNLSAFQRETD